MMFWLLIILVVLTLLLAVAAGWLWWRVWQARQRRQSQQQLAAGQEQQRLDYLHQSLNVIASAMLDDQCPMTEGCIRMAVLMDNLSLDCESKHRFSLIFEIYNATRHIPTHGQWQQLDKASKRRFRQEMWALERAHGDAVKDLLGYIKRNPFGKGVGASLH